MPAAEGINLNRCGSWTSGRFCRLKEITPIRLPKDPTLFAGPEPAPLVSVAFTSGA
jgi:hypothetical protein